MIWTVGGGGSKISERGGRRRLLQPYPTEGWDGGMVWYGGLAQIFAQE